MARDIGTRRARLLLAAVACAADFTAACGGSADSPVAAPQPIQLTVNVVQRHGPFYADDAAGHTYFTCTVDLRASGAGGGKATWDGVTIQRFHFIDKSRPVETLSLSADTTHRQWGNAVIDAAVPQTSTWEFSDAAPFAITMDFSYRTGRTAALHTSVSFDCAPDITPNEPPGSIPSIEARPSRADLQHGDTIMVSYVARSPYRVWRSTVEASGPCVITREFVDGLSDSVSRTVALPIPVDCALGVPFQITVRMVDGALAQVSRSMASALMVVDKTPPTFTLQRAGHLFGDSTSTTPTGKYFAGETIDLTLTAADNYSVQALIWEVSPAGFRDSVLVSGRSIYQQVKIPVRAEWTGPITLSVYARDAVGLESARISSPPNSLVAYPTLDRAVRTAMLGADIVDEVFDTRRDLVYLFQPSARQITALSLSTMQVTQVFSLPSVPSGFDITPHGDSLIAALPEQRAFGVIVLSAPNPTTEVVLLTTLGTGVGAYTARLRIASNERAFMMVSVPSQPYRILEVDLKTGTQRMRTDAPGIAADDNNESMERSHDHSTLTINRTSCVFRYLASTDQFDACRPLGSGPFSLDGTGQRFAIWLDVWDSSWNLVQHVQSPMDLRFGLPALTPDGTELYYPIWRLGVVRARVSDGAILDRILMNPSDTPAQIRISPDGRRLITIEGPAITVFDLR